MDNGLSMMVLEKLMSMMIRIAFQFGKKLLEGHRLVPMSVPFVAGFIIITAVMLIPLLTKSNLCMLQILNLELDPQILRMFPVIHACPA